MLVFEEAEVKRFAERVERLCDFLAEKASHGDDRNAIDELREEAANMQFADIKPGDAALRGIAEVLR